MQEKREVKPFLLVNLGTATNYTPELKSGPKDYSVAVGAKVKDYPKGETLSIIATLAEPGDTPRIDRIDHKNPRPYQSQNVVVVNGPDTRGTLVGQKIAQGLASALDAITRGQTSINIIAHSRGAVESVLVAHEMEAIQKAITQCATLDDLIKCLEDQQKARWAGKPYNNTPNIIATLKALLPQAKAAQDAWFTSLKENMPAVSINFFGIDPVPGDVTTITWYDDRYFTLPAIVKKAQIIYYENERSYLGFTPAFVEGTPGADQDIVRLTMLGHHGTGSTGSQGSQRNVVVAEAHEKTSHVQKLMIYKLLDFLSQNGVPFRDASTIFKKHSGLGTKYAQYYKAPSPEEVSIDEASAAAAAHAEDTPPPIAHAKTIDVKRLDFKTIFEKLYAEIATRRTGYAKFNQTNYLATHLASAGRLLLCKDAKKGGHAYRFLADEFPLNKDYINDEHGVIMQELFFRLFGVHGTDEGAAALIKRAHKLLETNIKKAAGLPDAEDLAASFVFLANETTPFDLRSARKDALKPFTAIVQKVSEQYLNLSEDWSSPEKQAEKEEIFTAIIALLKTLHKLAADLGDGDWQTFTTELMSGVLDGITKTIEYKHRELVEKFNLVQQSPNDKLTLFFSCVIQQQLQEMGPKDQDKLIEAQIQKLLEDPEYIGLKNHPIDAKIAFIWDRLALDYPKLAEGDDAFAKFKGSFNDRFDDKLDDFEELYQQIQIFIDDLGGLRRAIPEKTAIYDQLELSLHQKAKALIETAAQRFYKERAPDHLPDIAPKGSFADLAERHAINKLGLVDRAQEMHLALQRQAQDLQQRLSSAQDGKRIVEHDLATERKQRKELGLKLHDKTAVAEEQSLHLATEREQKLELAQQLDEQTVVTAGLERDLAAEQEQGRGLAQQLDEKTVVIEDLESNLAAAEQQRRSLTQQLKERTDAIKSLERDLAAEQEQGQGVAQQVQEQIVAKANLERDLATERTLAGELAQQLDEKTAAIKDLKSTLATEEQRAEELAQQLAEKTVVIAGLERNLITERGHGQELAQQLREKTDLIEELAQQLRDATGSKKSIDSDLEAEEAKAAKFHKAMNSKKEAQLLLLITDKLRPLTEEYLTSLMESKDTGALKTTKIERVGKLLECLNDDDRRPKPSARVNAFYKELNHAAEQLKTHRDVAWHRYVRNTLIVAGILISGILIGLAALAIYRNVGHSDTKSAAFWRSAGDNTVNNLQKIRPKLDDVVDSDVDAPDSDADVPEQTQP